MVANQNKFTKNDVLGYSGINHSRQNKFCKEAGIELNHGRIDGQLQHYYTEAQFKRLLKTAGWSEIEGTMTLSKRHITF